MSMKQTEIDPAQRELLKKIGTPARLAQHTSKDLLGFQWEPAKHALHMEQRVLENVLDFSRRRFISIAMPPRHGKSFYCSLFLPAWFLGMFPEKRVILVAYSEEFAAQWGQFTRDLLSKYGRELFGRTISKSADSKTNWYMENSYGGMLAVGIGGGITGKGGDLVVIDDLIKNDEEARSSARKAAHIKEYTSSIRTRIEPGGTVVNVATRWAPDDLNGAMREAGEVAGTDPWEFVDFPAICEPPREWVGEPDEYRDELGRRPGDALWPERHPAVELAQTKASMVALGEELGWYALYQQSPRLSEGASFQPENWVMVPQWKMDELRSECFRLVRSWDLAASKDSGDWSVGALMGRHHNGNFYIFDVRRFREAPTETERRVLAAAQQDGPGVEVIIEEERAGAGKTTTEHYKRTLVNSLVEGIRVQGSKEERASIYAAKQGLGIVCLPEGQPWVSAWISEHKDFGYIRHDDQVDAGAQGFNWLASGGDGSIIASTSDVQLNYDALGQLQDIFERA